MGQRTAQQVLHYPRLDTVLMVEDFIQRAREYPTRMQLWRALPRGMQYQTFQLILNYLQESRKIFITKEGQIMWVFSGSVKAKKLLKESVSYVRSKASARV